MGDHIRRRFSWRDLPGELLESIVRRLNPNSDDLRSFRCVCKHWRSSIHAPSLALPPAVPVNIPSSHIRPVPFLDDQEIPVLIVSAAVYLLLPPAHHPSCTPWMVAVEQLNPRKVRLLHPLTMLPIRTLPENYFPKYIQNLSSIEISKGFNLRFNYGAPVFEKKAYKVLLWPNSYETSLDIEQSWVVTLDNSGECVWSSLNHPHKRRMAFILSTASKVDDIVIWRGMVMIVDRVGRLYRLEKEWNISVFVVHEMFRGYRETRKRLLLDSNTDELYLIVRDQGAEVEVCEHTRFQVYKLNEMGGVWEKVMITLEDRVLFVSFNTCFFVPVKDLPGFQKNCIVFPKDCFPVYNSGKNAPDDSEYLEVGVYKYGEGDNFEHISDCPGFSSVLWPPPQWIWEATKPLNS